MPNSADKFLSAKVKIKFLTLAFASGLVAAQPAQAQFPYWYLYAGQSLLYPLTRTLGSGLGSGLMYGPYNSNPFYSTSSFLRRTAGRASQFPYVYPYGGNNFGSSYGYRNGGLPPGNANGQNGDVMVDPNTGRTLDPDDAQASQANQSGQSGAAGGSPNFYLPGPQTQYQTLYGTPAQGLPPEVPPQNYPTPAGTPQTLPQLTPAAQQIMPPKAPGHKRKHSHSQTGSGSDSPASTQAAGQRQNPAVNNPFNSPLTSPVITSTTPPPAVPAVTSSATVSSGGSPLADGFVNHLVTKYDGHMGNALNNPDTRNWARAMGLIDGDHGIDNLPADRIEVMGKILKDNSLDSLSKVDALRILLKQKVQK